MPTCSGNASTALPAYSARTYSQQAVPGDVLPAVQELAHAERVAVDRRRVESRVRALVQGNPAQRLPGGPVAVKVTLGVLGQGRRRPPSRRTRSPASPAAAAAPPGQLAISARALR